MPGTHAGSRPLRLWKVGTEPDRVLGQLANYTLYIEDTIRIPKSIEAGEYVLGWRWDVRKRRSSD
eukprot:COSAG02_NODE_7898_length_2799_cov_2.162593_3_plen_64_part_01